MKACNDIVHRPTPAATEDTYPPGAHALCTAMRSARSEPVAHLDRAPLVRRLRLGTALTGLMLASYIATIGGLAVFFSGAILATQHVASGDAFQSAPTRYVDADAWQRVSPSHDNLDREFTRYSQQISQRHTW